jgi:hypothetical protein
MIARFYLLAKLFWRICRGVHFPPEALLSLAQCWREVRETRFADNHQIHVTHCRFTVSRYGAVDKCALDVVFERLKNLLRDRNQSCGLLEKLLQFPEHWRPGFGLKVGPCPFAATRQYSTRHERRKLPLKAGWGRLETIGKFRQIPPLLWLWLQKRSREHTLPHVWEQRGSARKSYAYCVYYYADCVMCHLETAATGCRLV